MSIFSKQQRTKVGSNTFNLSHDRKLSCKIGQLIPFFIMDTIPGDKTTISSSAMVRFAPLLAPVMHQVSIYMHYFFVPNRIMWKNWEKFITETSPTQTWPYFQFNLSEPMASGGIDQGSLWDYLGLPISNTDNVASCNRTVSALPAHAYWKIWFDYYRDQNLDSPTELELVNGLNSKTFYSGVRVRAWQHDYFTSALPWAQKGPEAMVPFTGQPPIFAFDGGGPTRQTLKEYVTGYNESSQPVQSDVAGEIVAGDIDAYIDLEGSHYADIESSMEATIADLRRAFMLQEFLEKQARGGSRYIEVTAIHFGVRSSDARLQRAEYLGGYRAPVKISEVLQNAPPTETSETPLATMGGHAVGIGGSPRISHYSEEHGYLMGIMSVMPRSAYQQGIPKHFLKSDKFDYYWPEFAHIGEQSIQAQELYQEEGEDGTDTFGYTPRYAEYKFINSSVHGDFRTTLDFWHMGRKFASKPALHTGFINMQYEEVDRIFAVQDDSDHLWCHVLNEVKSSRKMPYFGNPKM